MVAGHRDIRTAEHHRRDDLNSRIGKDPIDAARRPRGTEGEPVTGSCLGKGVASLAR